MNQSPNQAKKKHDSPPPPYIVEPSSQHTHSLILLHGLGSNGDKFGRELLETGLCSNGRTLTEIFPGVRFIFPKSKRRRSSAFGRSMLTQWFDIASLDDPSFRSHTQLQGLEESSREVLSLIAQESSAVTSAKVVIGGLSQGCAMTLTCLLALDFPVGAFLGMSGWLPFRSGTEDLLVSGLDEDSGDDNPFASSDTESVGSKDPIVRVRDFTRDLLSLNPIDTSDLDKSSALTPIFLGHGAADEKISPSLGKGASKTMESLGFKVSWRTYLDQGHWFKVPDEIDDIVEFLLSVV